jgi:hypothetical protein
MIAGLVLALALTVSLAAAQTSSSQTPTQGQATSPSPSAPSTQPEATPQAPTASPSQTAPEGSAGSQSQTAPRGQAGSASQTPSTSTQSQPAEKGASSEDELQLTDDQKMKLQPIIQEEMVQIDAVRTDNTLSPEQKKAKVTQIKQDHFPKIQAILTPEQRKKLADMQEKARQQHQGTSGTQSNPQQPPQ